MENEIKRKKVRVKLVGLDGNAFVLLGKFQLAAQAQGWPQGEIDKIREEATSGDYDHLLRVLMDNTESEDHGS